MTAGEPFCLLCGNKPCTCKIAFLGGYDMPNVSARVTINGKGLEIGEMEMVLNKLDSIERLLRIISSQLHIKDCNLKGGEY